jgi:dTDP-4-amino-4,6-dideoxygalactose transaminase
VDTIGLPVESDDRRSNWQSFSVALPDGIDQRALMQHMLDRGIATRRGIMCAHREVPYQHVPAELPHSEWCQDHTMILPLYVQMTEADIDRVGGALETSIEVSRSPAVH